LFDITLEEIVGESMLMDVLTYMVGAISLLAFGLMGLLIFQIYDEDHPWNQDRPEENTKINERRN
jgi:hypothetical protein